MTDDFSPFSSLLPAHCSINFYFCQEKNLGSRKSEKWINDFGLLWQIFRLFFSSQPPCALRSEIKELFRNKSSLMSILTWCWLSSTGTLRDVLCRFYWVSLSCLERRKLASASHRSDVHTLPIEWHRLWKGDESLFLVGCAEMAVQWPLSALRHCLFEITLIKTLLSRAATKVCSCSGNSTSSACKFGFFPN